MNNPPNATDQPRWFAVYHDGDPMAAYPSRMQATVYASGASSQDAIEIRELVPASALTDSRRETEEARKELVQIHQRASDNAMHCAKAEAALSQARGLLEEAANKGYLKDKCTGDTTDLEGRITAFLTPPETSTASGV